MRIEMSTDLIPIINPGLYGTFLGSYFNDCYDEFLDAFRNEVVIDGMKYINEVLEDLNIKAENGKFWSPQWYNYGNDQIHFDIVVDDNIFDVIRKETESEEFWNYVKNKREWHSYDGYMCFMPTERFNYYDNLKVGKFRMEHAVAMYINWKIDSRYDEKEFDIIQRNFEDDVIEEGNQNGWYNYDEEEAM